MKHAGKLFHLVHYVYRPSESVDPTGRLVARLGGFPPISWKLLFPVLPAD
jgi:hypothetical protein